MKHTVITFERILIGFRRNVRSVSQKVGQRILMPIEKRRAVYHEARVTLT